MGKTRVHELAQKMGLEDKEMLEKLQEAGIDAKTHMSVLEEDDVRRYQEASAPVEKVEEERITPGIIRRRRKEVAPPAPVEAAAPAPEEAAVEQTPPAPAAPAPVQAEAMPPVVSAPAETALAVEAPPTAPAPEAPPVVQETKSVAPESEAKPAPEQKPETPSAPAPAAAPLEAAEAAKETRRKESRPDRVTSSQARILGRVELPQEPPARREAPSRGPGRPQGGAPMRREEGAQGRRPATGDRPAAPVGARPAPGAGRPTPGGGRPAPAGGRPAPAGGRGLPPSGPGEGFAPKEQRGGKKNKKGKGADYGTAEGAESQRRGRRVEIFGTERNDKLRRGKRAPKPVKKTELTVSKAIKRIIRISDSITVGELAKRMGIKANDLIKELMRQGSMVTINHPLDFETAAVLASDFNYEVENVAFDEEAILDHVILKGEEEKIEDLRLRPPVVTIMGHVDHGKTSLLDAIRATNVTDVEAGGITQHIGAYDVEVEGRKITFVDTPGHEAFTAMRARGAKVTDIVILVVAADDGVMPQTKEAINHAKAAGVPILVAINKMDKADANAEKVKQELTEFALVPEEWGGETIFVEVSAKKRTNLEQLLEMVLLQAEVMDLKANPEKRAKGTIIEARLDRGRGPVATVLVQEGTLRVGDPIVSGLHFGRVRTMTDHRGGKVDAAAPSYPVEVTGLTGVPDAGDSFYAVEDEKAAKEVAQHRQQKQRETELAKSSKISLDQLYARIQQGDVKELRVIIKGDVQGSVEAVKDSLTKLSTDACHLVVLHTGVGGIIESDITLASASDAIIIGFNVRPEPKAALLADQEGVDIRLYNIIYDAVADVRSAMEGLLAPTLREKQLGRVEVRDTFSVSRVGTIAGCYVLEGKAQRNAQVRLVRDNVVVWQGKMNSLKRFKDDAREVATGYECGIGLENFNDIKVGDIIEVFEMEEVKTIL
ncbi:MAG: translation initiation factor IF-2 [Desulfuromonadales bacterium]